MLGADMGNIQILVPGTSRFRVAAHRGFSDENLEHFREVTEANGTACGRAVRARQRVIIPDVELDAAYSTLRTAAAAAGYRGVQATPLISRRGDLLGILSTHFRQPHCPTESQLRMLDLYAQQAVDAMEAGRIARTALRGERQLRFLDELNEATRSLEDPREILCVTTGRLGRALEVESCFYAEISIPDETLSIRDEWSTRPERHVGEYPLRALGAQTLHQLESAQTAIVDHVQPQANAGSAAGEQFLTPGAKAFLACPVLKGGRLAGLMAVQQSTSRNWQPDEIALLEQVVERSWAHLERVRVARELRESEERYRTFLTTIPAAVWTTDADGFMTRQNDSWSAYTGQTRDQYRGWGWIEAIHPEDRAAVDVIWRECVAQHHSYSTEYRLRRKDGQFRRVAARGAPVVSSDGTVREWVGICDDIHAQRQSESRNLFLVALDDAVRSLVDPQEITQTAARMLAQHLGASRCAYADVEADQDTFNLVGDYNEGVESIVGRYRFTDFGETCLTQMRNGQPFVSNDTFHDDCCLDARPAFKQAQIAAVICVPLQKGGQLTAAVAVHQATPRDWQADEIELVQQVSARCWESIERARITRELRQNEYRLRLAQRAGRIGSFEWLIPEGRMIWSDELAVLYGITPEEFGGTFEEWATRCVPEDVQRVNQEIAESLAAQETEITYEFRCIQPDGTQRWLRGQAMFLYDSAGQPRKMIGVNLDVNEQKRSADALLDADRRKDEFLATLAHELRNPLAPIRNAVEILQLGQNDPAAVREYQNAIDRQVQQMVRLVDDLLDVSRITRGKLELRKTAVELGAVLRSAIETSQPVIAASEHRLVAAIPEQPVWLEADHTRLAQVFSNLLNNAAKYSEPGREIRISTVQNGDYVEVQVTDQGIGIPVEMLDQIFEPFTQVDRSIRRSQGGLGIGLTLVKRLVELHGGQVHVRSGDGDGTTFSVRLPVPPGIQKQTVGGISVAGSPLPQRRILVVDDTPAALYMVAKLLEKLGQTVFTAGSAAEALERVVESQPDIVISDIGMPLMDGYQFAEALRKQPGLQQPWLVALTGYGQESDRIKATSAGFNQHLVKPVSLKALIEVLTQHPQAADPTTNSSSMAQ